MFVDSLILLLVGIAGGTLAGILGIGGGIIYILALEAYLPQLGIPLQELHQFVIANSLLAVFFASFSSCIELIRQHSFHYSTVITVALGATVASLFSTHFFVNTVLYSKTHFNYIVLCILGYMLFRVIRKITTHETDIPLYQVSKPWLMAAGIAGGVTAALSGLGGGVVMMPIFNTFLKINIKTCRSISLGVIMLTAGFTSILNLTTPPPTLLQHVYQVGYIFPFVILPIIAGVLIGGRLGVIVSKNLSSTTISIIYGIFLFAYILFKVTELVQWH